MDRLILFKINDPITTLKNIQERSWEIKKELTARVRHQLRSMPQLSFFIDDTLDYEDKMEQLFKEIDTLYDRYPVLVFKNQKLTPNNQQTFASHFGTLKPRIKQMRKEYPRKLAEMCNKIEAHFKN
jgi:hypothetical protein